MFVQLTSPVEHLLKTEWENYFYTKYQDAIQ